MPTNPAIPTLATGNVLSATQWNYLTALNGGLGLDGVGGALVTTTTIPTAQTPSFQMQAGSFTGSPVAGLITLTFPTAFTGGLLTVLATVGDATASFTQIQIQSGFSKTAVTFGCFTNTGAAVAATPIRINYIAIGW